MRGAKPSTLVDANGRECTNCHAYKPWSEFYSKVVKRDTQLPYTSQCKLCINEAQLPRSRAVNLARKRRVMDAYGGKCACCGESELAFLQLDHINNDGAAHRRELSPDGKGGGMYCWIVRNDFPEGFQVLCANCNFAKQIAGTCPHKEFS